MCDGERSIRCSRGVRPSCIHAAAWGRARDASVGRRPSSCLAGILSMPGRLSIPHAYPQSHAQLKFLLTESDEIGLINSKSDYRKRRSSGESITESRKFERPTPTSRYFWRLPRCTLSRRSRAILISSSQDEMGAAGVWLRVTILNSSVLSFSTIVRAILDSFSEVCHTF